MKRDGSAPRPVATNSPNLLSRQVADIPGQGARVEFVFGCWCCCEDNFLIGRQVGFWADKWELPTEWDCWNCGCTNITHDPPWTEA
ncbi:hypothetical protein [Streptomyces sp. NPDC093269]|uniref:hypothetical protein n=1 Tax=Streptomyces sp. NPDC093269 TaxID=3366038 RepID=UPI00380E4589